MIRHCVFVLASCVALASAAPAQESAEARQVASLLKQAAAAEEAGNAEEAIALLRGALDVDLKNVAANVALGRLLYANGDTAEAIGLLWRANEIAPKNVDAALALADVLLQERDFYDQQGDASSAAANLSRAREVLDQVQGEPGAAAPTYRIARVHLLLRCDDGAKEAYAITGKLLAEQPADLALHALHGDAVAAAKEFDAALAWYEKAELEPWIREWFTSATLAARGTWNYNNYVDDEAAVKDYAAAETHVLEAARLHPEIFDAASERASFDRAWAGWVRHRQERLDEAFDLFMSAWGRCPTNETAITGLFYVSGKWYEAGDLEKAREGYRQLCTVAPERAEFWNNYALICRDTGKFEESFRAYRRAMAVAPTDARVINDCALILHYHLHRDLDQAERWYIQAEDLARAALAQAINDGDEGRANEQRGIVGDTLTNLARLYADAGRAQESAENWNELRELDSKRPELPENGGH